MAKDYSAKEIGLALLQKYYLRILKNLNIQYPIYHRVEPSGVSIEPANSSDVDALLNIEHAVFIKSDGIITRRTFLKHIRSKNILLVARNKNEDQEVAGYILIYVHKLSARIYSLAVHPEYQCRGVAKTLIKHALDKFNTMPLCSVKLEFRTSNQRVKTLYESFGFRQKKLLHDYYADHEDAISMILTLEKRSVKNEITREISSEIHSESVNSDYSLVSRN